MSPPPHSRNAYFFITRLYIVCQKPKFRQCYFLVNIKNIKIDILGHILVPVSDGTGGRNRVPPYISSTIEYGSFRWDNCQKGEKEELEKFQMSIARTVTGARKGTSHNLILNELNWPSLADRREGAKLKNFINIFNK